MKDTMVASVKNCEENYLESIFEFGCRSRNAERLSCKTVVAGGLNSTMLHYDLNNQTIPENSLVLVDGGAQFAHYNCDLGIVFCSTYTD